MVDSAQKTPSRVQLPNPQGPHSPQQKELSKVKKQRQWREQVLPVNFSVSYKHNRTQHRENQPCYLLTSKATKTEPSSPDLPRSWESSHVRQMP